MTLTATAFVVLENPEKDYAGGYNELELREYLANAKEVEQKKILGRQITKSLRIYFYPIVILKWRLSSRA